MKIKIEAEMGEHIAEAARRAIDAARTGAKVDFSFNEVALTVTATSTAGDVCAEYDRICEARAATYRASPEYKKREREAEEREAARTKDLAAVLALAPEKMTLRNPERWAAFVAANTDGYGGACVSYAERWARVMEGRIAQGATVAGCAKDASHLADTEGITGFMYGCAVSMLAEVWQHGEELRQWHNRDTQIGHEGDEANKNGGVLNPALLNIR